MQSELLLLRRGDGFFECVAVVLEAGDIILAFELPEKDASSSGSNDDEQDENGENRHGRESLSFEWLWAVARAAGAAPQKVCEFGTFAHFWSIKLWRMFSLQAVPSAQAVP